MNDKYAVADPNYPTNVAFEITGYDIGHAVGGPIQKELLDLQTPATPAFLKHSVHGAISYTLSEWDNPLVMGCGFSIDWTHDNSTATGYVLWAKMGATF